MEREIRRWIWWECHFCMQKFGACCITHMDAEIAHHIREIHNHITRGIA